LGLIGRNGAGKTTLLRILNGLIKPDTGRISVAGKTAALIALGAGFNPILTGRENVKLSASILGLSKFEIDDKLEEIIEFAEIDDFIDTPVQNYSSGMQVRLGFAAASVLNPDVLILDEVLAVGDLRFRMKCYAKIDSMRSNTAVIFVSHSLEHIGRICSRAILMSNGQEIYQGDVPTALSGYVASLGGESSAPSLARYVDNKYFESVEVKPGTNKLESGDRLTLSLNVIPNLDTVVHFRLGLFSMSTGEIVGTAESRLIDQDGITMLANNSLVIDLTIPITPLRSGSYDLRISIFEASGNSLIFASSRECDIEVHSSFFGENATMLPLSCKAKAAALRGLE
jgi:lipopolysaccharide transport system ATP-binding protein